MFFIKLVRRLAKNCLGYARSLINGFLKNVFVISRMRLGDFAPKRDLYGYFEHRYIYRSPEWLRDHRRYFSESGRGFGASAFHVAWYDVLRKYRPKHLLEIGVYRGQVISLWQLIADKVGLEVDVSGISPLDSSGDQVSNYPKLDYKKDIEKNFKYFGLTSPKIIASKSTHADAVRHIKSRKWDLIYLDGNHDFDVVLSDYQLAVENLNRDGILCLDDSSLFLSYPILGNFKGHEGPSRIMRDYALHELKHLFTVGHINFFAKR